MYNDLLSFEEDVCTLVDVVLVFLETEGAIAEFAALIKHENIAPKLLIVVNQEHYESDSFIKLGLLRYLEAAHKGSDNIVVAHNNPLIRAELDHILKLLEQRSQQQPKIESFRQKNLRHIFYLIVDFIDILQVARISDIQLMLKKLGISYSKNRLEQLLSALKNAELIREDKMLSERCFSAISTPRASIEYAFVKSPGKRVTWKARAFENTLGDKWRAYAFRTLKSKDISKSEVVNGA
ncbi:MAG: putative inner rane protein [Herbaspirillum sp.]|nr:putative inner rane protein [Herbaspirillum sp.]